MSALWLDSWPLACTCTFAIAASLWAYWALGSALYAGLLSVPASCGFGYLMSAAARRRP